MRIVDWYLGLGLGQKIVVGLAAAVVLFLASFWGALWVFSLFAAGDEEGAPAQATAPGITYPEASSLATPSPEPDLGLKISGARWEGEKAVVEGTWRGNVSSVHCDLLEGGTSGKPTHWWDRSVGTQMDWSGRTFAQEFVAAEKGEGGEPLDPVASYGVVCSAQFSGGWSVNDVAPVEGSLPD